MGNLIVDTAKLKESGEDIMRLSSELNEQINALFSRISNMNCNTLEWIGNSADEFVRITNLEKTQYINLKNTLYGYGKALSNAANEYEQYMDELR